MLTGHSQNSNLRRALPLIDRARPPFWVALDPDPTDAADAAQRTDLVVRRHWRYDFNEGAVRADMEMGRTPADCAREFVASCQAQGWYPWAWAVMTPPAMAVPSSPPDLLAWAIAFQTACVRLFEAHGRACFVSNVPTHNDGYYVPDARFYCAQEYGWPDLLTQAGEGALRYRTWFPREVLARRPDAALLIAECGVTQLVDGHGPDVGWHSDGRHPDVYWYGSLVPYARELARDAYVLGAAVFQAGGNPDWSSFEILDTPIEEYLATQAHQASEEAPSMMGPDILHGYSSQFQIWWEAGGWRNFASFLVATGQLSVTDAERRDLVTDRLTSATKETEAFLAALALG